MAFKNKDLSVLAYANGFTLWHYTSDEPMDEITKKGYFDPIYTLVGIGDLFIINAADTTKTLCLKSIKPMILMELGGKYDETN